MGSVAPSPLRGEKRSVTLPSWTWLPEASALLCVWALQAGARWRSAALAALTLAASPVAFLILLVVLGCVALTRRPRLVPAPHGRSMTLTAGRAPKPTRPAQPRCR